MNSTYPVNTIRINDAISTIKISISISLFHQGFLFLKFLHISQNFQIPFHTRWIILIVWSYYLNEFFFCFFPIHNNFKAGGEELNPTSYSTLLERVGFPSNIEPVIRTILAPHKNKSSSVLFFPMARFPISGTLWTVFLDILSEDLLYVHYITSFIHCQAKISHI